MIKISKIKEIVKKNYKSVKDILFCILIGFLFAKTQFLFSSIPFGFALISAVSADGLYTLIGIGLGILFSPVNKILYFTVSGLLLFARVYISARKFNENYLTRIIEGSVAYATFGTLQLIVISAGATKILSLLFGVVCTAMFTFLFLLKTEKSDKFMTISEAGTASFIFCFILSINSIEFFGFYPAVILSFLITVILSFKCGFMKGGIIGLICGLACKGADVIIYSPLLGISGIVSGILFGFSDTLAIVSVIVIAVLYGIYSSDMQRIGSIFQNTVAFSMIYIPLAFIYKKYSVLFDKKSDDIQIYDYALPTFTGAGLYRERITKLADTYNELSALILKLGKYQVNPTSAEIGAIIKEVITQVCFECASKDFCKSRKDCLSQIAKLSKKYLLSTGTIPAQKEQCLPEDCRNKEIIKKISEKYEALKLQKCEKDCCKEISEDMSDVSKVLSSVADDKSDLLPNPYIASKVSASLSKQKIFNTGVYAQGKRGITVYAYGIKPKEISLSVNEIAKIISNDCEIRFSAPTITFADDLYTLNLKRQPKYKTDCSCMQIAKDGNTVNGDSYCSFFTSSDFYAILCDGMGSGLDAALTSRISCIMLEKLLSGGCTVKTATDILNKMLIKKYDEIFTSLDIFRFDIFSGDGFSTKAGAADTMIIRGDKYFKVNSKTLPAGIVDEFCPEATKLRLSANDTVIMFSDGFAEIMESPDNIYDLVKDIKDYKASDICEVLNDKIKSFPDHIDDASVIVIKILQ